MRRKGATAGRRQRAFLFTEYAKTERKTSESHGSVVAVTAAMGELFTATIALMPTFPLLGRDNPAERIAAADIDKDDAAVYVPLPGDSPRHRVAMQRQKPRCSSLILMPP